MKSLLRKTQIMWGDIVLFIVVVFPIAFLCSVIFPDESLSWWQIALFLCGANTLCEILLGERKRVSGEETK